jgi:hypothetical protein
MKAHVKLYERTAVRICVQEKLRGTVELKCEVVDLENLRRSKYEMVCSGLYQRNMMFNVLKKRQKRQTFQ